MNECAYLLVDQLLTNHYVEESDQDQIRDLDRIMVDAKQEILLT